MPFECALAALLLCRVEPLVQFGKGYCEKQFCEIILNSGQWFSRRCRLKDFLLVERNHLCNFKRGYHGEHSCEVIGNLDQRFRRRCRLKKKFMDGRRHYRQRPITIAHLESAPMS